MAPLSLVVLVGVAPASRLWGWSRFILGPGALRVVPGLRFVKLRAFAWRFWGHAPPSETALGEASGCRLAAGLGEAPIFRPATFSLWNSLADMDACARGGGHLAVLQASLAGRRFSESMFVRFLPLQPQGAWKGQHFG